MKQTFIIFFVLAALAISCHSPVKGQLSLADSLLNTHPDSSLAILTKLDKSNLKNRDDKAYYALLMSAALDKNYIDISNDSLINHAVDYYVNHGSKRDQMRAWYYQGIVRINAKEYTSAIVSLEKAERLAEDLSDYRFIGLINRNKAVIFNATNNFETAIGYCERAISAFVVNNDTRFAEHMKYTLAITYFNNHEITKARVLLRDIIDHSQEGPFVSQAKIKYAEALLSKNDSVSVALQLYRETPKRYYTSYMDYGYYAYALAKTGQRDSANYWMSVARNLTQRTISTATLDYLLAQIDIIDGNYQSAYNKVSFASHVQDSLTRVLLRQSLSNAQRDYYQMEMGLQESIIQKQKKTFLLGSITVMLLLLLIGVILRERSKKREALVKEHMAELLVLQKELQKDKSSLVGALFVEKIARLSGLSDSYYISNKQKDKNEAFSQFKKTVSDAEFSSEWKAGLENDLNKYCSGIMDKLGKQVPRIKGDNRTIIALFFAGIPDSIVQLLMSRTSTGSLKTMRSRFRREIKDAHAPDEALFLEMLNVSDKPKWQ